MNETDLRTLLREHAASFDPRPGWSDNVRRSGPQVRRRAITAASLLTAAVAVGATMYVDLDTAPPAAKAPDGSAQSTTTTPPPASGDPVTIELVGYAAPVGGYLPEPLRQHVECMRAHGFTIPDPVWTGHGWLLTVEDAKSLGLGTPRWKQTAFVTCALTRRGDHVPSEIKHAILHPRPRALER